MARLVRATCLGTVLKQVARASRPMTVNSVPSVKRSAGLHNPPIKTPAMTWFRFRVILAVFILAACGLTGGAAEGIPGPALAALAYGADDPLNPCERAGVAEEQASGLPPGLLLAIGRVESGRWDSARGRVTAWPWTINAAGKGQWFETKTAATQTVRDLTGGGTRSIDVGCFQINLMWHPAAFPSLEQAFDPAANAAYAARFLLSLFGQTGSWEAAVETYHSADPTLGFAYRKQVYATWAAAAPVTASVRAGPVLAVAPHPAAMPIVIAGVRIWTRMPIGTAPGVVVMPGSPAAIPSHSPSGDGVAPLPVVSYRVMPADIRSIGIRPLSGIPRR
jgi:hypothetical protein